MVNQPEPAPDDVTKSEFAKRPPRRQVGLSGRILFNDGSALTITIVDLSYDGCRIETPIVLAEGASFKLSAFGLGAVRAETRWSRNGEAGLRFYGVDESTAPAAELRSQERQLIEADILFRRQGGLSYRSDIRDLSLSGCKVSFVELPRVGDAVWVKFPFLDALEGRVRWVSGGTGGVEFIRSIYPAVFKLLISRLQTLAA